LQQPGVKAVIVGARNQDHLERNLAIPNILFSEEEISAIGKVLEQSKEIEGDVYYLERYDTRHRSIIHTNNN
jgi:diketogulonate reductase-like aldo/keto reductase